MKSVYKRWVSVTLGLMVLLFAASAVAAPRLQWSKLSPKEREGGSWKLEFKLFLDKAPTVAHVPMKIEFVNTVYYERTLVDGKDKPILRKVPVKDKQAIIESITVGFLDPGTGQTQKRTRFAFKITRGQGFEAGEYKLQLRDGRNGRIIGRSQKLVLNGDNKPVDRRTMTFAGKKKEKKVKKVDKDGNIIEDGEERKKEADDGVQVNQEKDGWDPIYGAEESEAADPESDPEQPQEIKEKPGGCGCQTPGSTGSGAPAVLLLGTLGFAFLRRRQNAA